MEGEKFQINIVDKIKHTFHVKCNFPQNRVIYEMITKNSAESDKGQMI